MVRPTHPDPKSLVVRTFRSEDQPVVARLYTQGLLAGQIPPNDTGVDIDHLAEAYLSDPASHFWVAEVGDEVVGMVGVARESEHTAEIRRLRVDKGWQRSTVAARLVEMALKHCREHAYLKVVLDTRFERSAAVGMFERFGFQYTGTRATKGGKELLEFYLDLYHPSDQDLAEL